MPTLARPLDGMSLNIQVVEFAEGNVEGTLKVISRSSEIIWVVGRLSARQVIAMISLATIAHFVCSQLTPRRSTLPSAF